MRESQERYNKLAQVKEGTDRTNVWTCITELRDVVKAKYAVTISQSHASKCIVYLMTVETN